MQTGADQPWTPQGHLLREERLENQALGVSLKFPPLRVTKAQMEVNEEWASVPLGCSWSQR